MKLIFFIMSFFVLVAFITVLVTVINIWRKYRRERKVDTSKVDAEIDRLLSLDEFEKHTYHE